MPCLEFLYYPASTDCLNSLFPEACTMLTVDLTNGLLVHSETRLKIIVTTYVSAGQSCNLTCSKNIFQESNFVINDNKISDFSQTPGTISSSSQPAHEKFQRAHLRPRSRKDPV
ncbi:hypothetical protein KC19_2G127100 [Ceratodon purpureus]|uniref:Uncharacterized protein n=1 Tax=Ceratodon purpureus TaxID=3225 RepID=A0A8T0IUX4_CERPU|nr:hypothetical protein KC19_2G127100 [Ceratodon purpureus]